MRIVAKSLLYLVWVIRRTKAFETVRNTNIMFWSSDAIKNGSIKLALKIFYRKFLTRKWTTRFLEFKIEISIYRVSTLNVLQYLIPKTFDLDMYFQLETCLKKGKQSLYVLFKLKNAIIEI